MGGNYTFEIKILGNGAVTAMRDVSRSAGVATESFENLSGSMSRIGTAAFAVNNINDALNSLSGKLDESIAPGIALNTSLTDLSALTGVTGKGLREIGGYARGAAKTFGGSAARGVESYKLVLSQLSPEIAKVPEALASMGTHVTTLSKTMGGDTAAAAEVLTTAMNQFKVSTDDPIRAAAVMGSMMNVMSAAAKEGSAELPQIKAALEQSGMAAKMAGVSFEETNAAIQVLDKAGKKGSEGGVALRNTLSVLSQGRFLPKEVQEELAAAGVRISDLTNKALPLSGRLASLKGILGDDALMTKLFGRENSNAALALVSGTDLMRQYEAAIGGTTSATDQAAVVMGSYAEKMSRQKAYLDDLKISFFAYVGPIMPYVKGAVTAFQGLSTTLIAVNAASALSESAWGMAIRGRVAAMRRGMGAALSAVPALVGYGAAAGAGTVASWSLAGGIRAIGKAIYSIPIVGWIAAGISVAIAAVSLLWEKCEGFRKVLFASWEVVKAVFHNASVLVVAFYENVTKPVFGFIWDTVKMVASGIWEALKWCWDMVAGGAVALWGVISDIWGWIGEKCASVASFVSEAFRSIAEPIRGIFSRIGEFVGGVFSKVVDRIAGPLKWIRELWNKLFPTDKFRDLGDAAEDGLRKGSESFRRSEERKGGKGATSFTLPAVLGQDGGDTTAGVVPGKAPKGKGEKGRAVILDLKDVKGTTAYNAIASRLAPTRIGGLSMPPAPSPALPSAPSVPGSPSAPSAYDSARQEYGKGGGVEDILKGMANNVSRIAASVAIMAAVSASAVPPSPAPISPRGIPAPETVAPSVPRPSRPDRRTGGGRSITIDRLCDNIVINTTASGGSLEKTAKEICRLVIKELNEYTDDF